MFIVLAIYYLTGQGVHALPVPLVDQLTSPSCSDCRTRWDIIWSCLATIFSCAYMAIHPNIPDPDERGFLIILRRRLQLVILALIAPELIIVWAIHQLLIARKLVTKYSSAFDFSYESQIN
jgi:hypothetical protein